MKILHWYKFSCIIYRPKKIYYYSRYIWFHVRRDWIHICFFILKPISTVSLEHKTFRKQYFLYHWKYFEKSWPLYLLLLCYYMIKKSVKINWKASGINIFFMFFHNDVKWNEGSQSRIPQLKWGLILKNYYTLQLT